MLQGDDNESLEGSGNFSFPRFEQSVSTQRERRFLLFSGIQRCGHLFGRHDVSKIPPLAAYDQRENQVDSRVGIADEVAKGEPTSWLE